jgi:hypothetical protein
MPPPFREYDLPALMGLADYRERWLRRGEAVEWARPMDIGGRADSGTSQSLARLVRLGLAERRQRTDCGTIPSGRARPSFEYKITGAGLALLTETNKAGAGG